MRHYTSSVCAADLNGDGKLDLICANVFSNSLTVLTNNGSGGFGSNATYTVGSEPNSVCAADVKEDGKLALICANVFGNSLTVLTNNGSGGFGSNATYTVGNQLRTEPLFVCAADVNGDSYLDLICANTGSTYQGTSLTILTNDEHGGFVIASIPTVGKGPVSVCAVDVNGDGNVDLISANFTAGTLTVLTNNGSGGFGSNATYNVGGGPHSICAADVNRDGKVDLICANQGDNTLKVLTNNANGGFVLASTNGAGSALWSVCAVDIKGDGNVDLIYANAGGNTLTVLTNNGTGGFGSNATYNVGAATAFVCAADINGNGKMDLIVANSGDNTLMVLTNNTIFPPPTSMPSVAVKTFGHGLVVSWPSASAGWSLQQNPDLTAGNWSPSGYSGYNIADDGTKKSLIIMPPTRNLFLRLLHP
jgi:hypothetical protein